MPRIGSAIKALARRLGVDIARHDPWSLPAARRSRLLAEGCFELVLDVGANSGQTGVALRNYGYRGPLVSFEPLRDAFERLQSAAAGDPGWQCRNLALGEQSGTRLINVATNDGASSSFYPLADAHVSAAPTVAYRGTETVEMASLDELAPELVPETGGIWLKLDVQGYESQVLEGAAATLPRIDAVELELSLVELYDGQPLFDEVLRALQDAGFRTVDVSPEFVNPTTGRLLQVNVIALRP
jgi:FkbM family methyltransferase